MELFIWRQGSGGSNPNIKDEVGPIFAAICNFSDLCREDWQIYGIIYFDRRSGGELPGGIGGLHFLLYVWHFVEKHCMAPRLKIRSRSCLEFTCFPADSRVWERLAMSLPQVWSPMGLGLTYPTRKFGEHWNTQAQLIVWGYPDCFSRRLPQIWSSPICLFRWGLQTRAHAEILCRRESAFKISTMRLKVSTSFCRSKSCFETDVLFVTERKRL